MRRLVFRLALCFPVWCLATAATPATAAELELQPGDHICLVGNALGERMQHHNYWETLLYQRFPEHELVVRNLCFPADEVAKRLRSLNFGSPDEHLAHSQASVILFFFGYNESFEGEAGRDDFAANLKQLIEHTGNQNYSGNGPPRIVLVSPIAFENTGDPNLPDGTAHNRRLSMYTETMREVAEETGVGFADLFTPTKKLFESVGPARRAGPGQHQTRQEPTRSRRAVGTYGSSEQRLTLNGAHLNEAGYQALAPILDRALFGTEKKPGFSEKPGFSDPSAPTRFNKRLRAEIDDKNFHWWHRYRAVNGYSIYGKRGEAGFDGTYRNRDVMERERKILDQMCANRDRRIWKIAQGKAVPDQVDDSNTLPFIEPKTNVGGADDPNRKRGKLGSLEYIPAEEQQKYFKLAEGYEINLVASEEMFTELANPVAMNFDSRGRLWVSVMPSYPQFKPKTKLDDKLLILEDHNGDGRADECKTFADGLHVPTGFELGYGGAFVAQQPDVLFLKDTDGDDRADERIRLLVGLDSADSHHGPAAFEWGPGGGLYFQEGTFKQSQLETPYGPSRLSDAGVWRYEPRSERLTIHSSFAFANPWGHVFDRWGQNFIADASPGYNYWAAPISGYVGWPDKHPGGVRGGHLDWGGSHSEKEYPTFIKKRIRPSSGCEIVSSRHFPPEAQGNILINNVIGDLGVLQYTMTEDGSGFGGNELTQLVLSEHGNFRPVDLKFGPDGALYIVDWHNALIGHLQHNLRDPNRDHSHGRIWRVTYKHRPLLDPPKIAGAPIPDLLELLKEPEDRTRYRVRRELAQRETDDVIAALEKWIAGLHDSDPQSEHLLLEALWLYQTHNVVNEDLLEQLLEASDPHARAAATRVLSFWRNRVSYPLKMLHARVTDPHPRVRLEAVRGFSFFAKDFDEAPKPASTSTGPDNPLRARVVKAFEHTLDVLNHEMDGELHYTLDETLRVLEDSLYGTSGGWPEDAPGLLFAEARSKVPPLNAAHHAHHGGQNSEISDLKSQKPPKPLVFLDKPSKIVEYQLNRLSASQLLRLDRKPSDPKYKPVYKAILLRPGVSRQDREESVAALSQLNDIRPVQVLLASIGEAELSPGDARSVIDQLASILLNQPAENLSGHEKQLRQAAASENKSIRSVALAGLIAAGETDAPWNLAAKSPQGRRDFLSAVPRLPRQADRVSLRGRVISCLDESQPVAVRRAAIEALASIPANQEDTFSRVAPLVGNAQLRTAAVRTLLQIYKAATAGRGSGHDQRSPLHKEPEQVVRTLVQYAENTPPAKRTTAEFLDAMNLADELLAVLPVKESRSYRQRLREVVVRVVLIKTVQEEMRYDKPYFAVEAGRPVQVVLRNEDLMPHNLLICAPGTIRDVAMAAAEMGPEVDAQGRQYVPKTDNVLHAMKTVQAGEQEVLTFTAPEQPGEYPYVCTFPNHWTRMYGVMVVVEDLEAWRAAPTEPADPLGNTRPIVQNWTMDDFPQDLAEAMRGRQPEIGKQIFEEATCLQCHKIGKDGGAVGPELNEVFERHKGELRSVLHEIIDPSHKVASEYALYNVVTTQGQVISGIIKEQDRRKVTLITNPEKPTPQVIPRQRIVQMAKSSVSLMPKGLMDRYTQDEIFELLAYLKANQSTAAGDGVED